ncbi:hypothetical protein Tco_0403790 [Tanacetum coccineum]
MVVHNQEEIGESSAIPTDPYHIPTFIQPSPQPQKTQKPRRPKKKDTQVPQSSVPSDTVADEAIYKELDDSLVRAVTTTSSLEAEQDSGNIIKTRSKATPNEAGSQGTSSGCGPRRQETMGDTIAQTRFENVSKLSNDPLLARDKTLQSGEDSLKLNELMELCTDLQQRVLDLETTKTTQANEIASLKRRVKKLKKKDRSRTHKLKRLYKVGLSARVESSRDEEDLVNDDNEIFDVDALAGEEVFVAEKSGNVFEEVVVVIDAASTIPVSVATITNAEITLVQALAELKSAKPKANKDKGKGIMIEEPVVEQQEELTDEEKARLFIQFLKQRRKDFAAKRAEEKRNRPPTRAQQRNIMCTYLKNMEGWKPKSLKNKSFANIQELFEKVMKRVNTFVDYRTKLMEESSKKAKTELEENLKKAEAEVMEGSSKRVGKELEQEIIKMQKELKYAVYGGFEISNKPYRIRAANLSLEINNPDVTMEEYVQYKTEKALRNNQAYNWETAKYDKIWVLALGWNLEEIHVTWANLEKKQTRLQTYTKSMKKYCSQSVETASQA